MKRYMRGLVATIASLALMSGVASAESEQPTTCANGEATITSTGEGSVNMVTCVDSKEIHVTCDNNIYVVNDSSQTANSGDASNSGSTDSGSSISGSATNENGATVEIGTSCVIPSVTNPESPTPEQPVVSPINGLGMGMGEGAPAAEATQTIASLPNTSSNTVLDSLLVGGSGLIALLIASRLSTATYRHFALR